MFNLISKAFAGLLRRRRNEPPLVLHQAPQHAVEYVVTWMWKGKLHERVFTDIDDGYDAYLDALKWYHNGTWNHRKKGG